MSNSIDSSLYLSNRKEPEKKTGPQTMGKNEFIKILMTQLQNQDPSNPMEDREFISQMATFSSLEQMTNLNETMQQFMGMQRKSTMANFLQFIGKEVGWEKVTESEGSGGTSKTETGSGIVSSIEVNGNDILLTLDDGSKITQEQMSKVNSANPGYNKYAAASTLIGKQVTILDQNTGEPTDYAVKSAHFNNGKTSYELDNGTMIDPTQILKISV